MRRWLPLLVLALLLLCASSAMASQAHKTTWYWSRGSAAAAIEQEGLHWSNEFDEVLSARCYGYGPWIPSKKRGITRLFKHFRCRIYTYDDEAYWIVFHAKGRHTWTFTWLRWER